MVLRSDTAVSPENKTRYLKPSPAQPHNQSPITCYLFPSLPPHLPFPITSVEATGDEPSRRVIGGGVIVGRVIVAVGVLAGDEFAGDVGALADDFA